MTEYGSALSTGRITVFVPTYNRARYLRRCLEALEQQDIAPSDLVVVVSDNASEDETPEVVKEFSSLKIRYNRNEKNLRIYANFNRVLSLCETEFVVLLPDDVLLAPGFLGRALRCLSRDEGATMYATAALVVNPSIHTPVAKVVAPPLMTPNTFWPLHLQSWGYGPWAAACGFRPPVYTGAAAFRFSLLEETMPWPEEYVANADRLTYFEAGRKGRVLFDPWIGAHAIYDGHNFGEGIPARVVQSEYREVTRLILEQAGRDGIDVLGYWRKNLENYPRRDREEILESAKFALSDEVYRRAFSDSGVAVGRLNGPLLRRWGVPPV